MSEEGEQSSRKTVTVGLMADPGLPLKLAERIATALPDLLENEIEDGVEWVVKAEENSLPLDAEGAVELTRNSSTLREQRGWEYMVYVTDLPKYILNEPLVVILNTAYGAGMIVVPALGVGGARPLRRLLLHVLSTLYAGASDRGRPRGPLSAIERIASVDHEADERKSKDTVETLKGVSGRLTLLTGMVRSNTPLKLVPRLSTALAGAIGTAAFGIFYASIWSMADYLSGGRMLLISLLSVATMTVWLIGSHGLWEKPEGAHRRERRVLYNAATTATVLIAVAAMYLTLFAVVLLGALVVIDVNFLEEHLREQAGFIDYVNLAWLATSMGTIGGAVGSSFSDAEVVRRATFSNREYERRQMSLREEKRTIPPRP